MPKTSAEISAELIKGISAMLPEDAPALTPETALTEIGMDSLMLVEIFVLIEKRFGLKLLDSNIGYDDLKSISTLASFIERKL